MSAETLGLEGRFELTSQKPVLEGSNADLMRLADVGATIGLISPGGLSELERATREIMLFDSLHSPQDQYAVFFPFPRFKRNNWQFKTQRERILSARYQEYLLCLRRVLKDRPGDWFTIGSGSVKISEDSQLAIVSVSAPSYFNLEIRKKGPDFRLYVNTQKESDEAIAVAPSGVVVEVIRTDSSVRSTYYRSRSA